MFQVSPSFKHYTGFGTGITKPRCIAPDPIGAWTSQYNFHFPPPLSVLNEDDNQYIRENVRCRLIHDVPRPYTSLYFMLSQYNPWLDCEMFDACWGFYFDSLTVSMCFTVTLISTLVHLYSTSYMSHDPHQPRFMAYLSLFTFFMLMLITADNFIQLFLGWEGVGLCSYLLINF